MKSFDVVCVNDLFTLDARKVYEQYGIVTPREGVYYTIRDIVISRLGTGLLLEELVNPKLPIGEGESGFMVEPNFGIFRFRNLDNSEITESQIQEFLIEKKSFKHLEAA